MISNSSELSLKPIIPIIKFTSEAVQTDDVWVEDGSNVEQSDLDSESLIDLTSSLDEFEQSLTKNSDPESCFLPISLFNNDHGDLCKAFCETYKEFFNDVYLKEEKTIEENSSIHQQPIQDNFAKEKIILEEKLIIKDTVNSELVLYSSNIQVHQQKDFVEVSTKNLNNFTVTSSCAKYNWSHFDGANNNKLDDLTDKQCTDKEEQKHDLLEVTNETDTLNENTIECLFDERLLKHIAPLNSNNNQGQEKIKVKVDPSNCVGSPIAHNTQKVFDKKINNAKETNNKEFCEVVISQQNKYKGTNGEEEKSDEKSIKDSKFEASVRLKKLEERINNHTVKKLLPNNTNEIFDDIQKSPSIQLKSSCSSVVYDENAANTSGKSRVDSCIDFLNFSEKGEISLTPETNIRNKLDKTNSSSSNICETVSEKNNENKKVSDFGKLSKDFEKKNNFLKKVKDNPIEIDEHNFLENKTDETFEKDKNVFQILQHVLEDSPTSDPEICRIFSKETLDFKNSICSETSETFLSNLPKSHINLPQRELTTSKLYTRCEFNARDFAILNHFLNNNNIHECYDELAEEFVEQGADCYANCENLCDCTLEAIGLYNPVHKMRETNMGPLKGLLKKPNRPPASRKNRVVFDETKNQFFDADYIILIREDCLYDEEEDNEPCTCGEHELVRICCDEGCCGYTDDGRTPPSPKFAPPIEFVDQATLSPPEGYKDAGGNLIDSALQGALGGHVFGAQHIQQLQVIQRLQQQRAAMLAAKAAQSNQQTSTNVCVECAECSECAAKQFQEESGSQCSDEVSPACELPIALVPITNASPERRIIQKEIVAGEERPRISSSKLTNENLVKGKRIENVSFKPCKPSYILETITMLTVNERHIIYEATDLDLKTKSDSNTQNHKECEANDSDEGNTAKINFVGSINGILKGGRLRKGETAQLDDSMNTTSDDETGSKRSVRFTEETKEREGGEGEPQLDVDYRHPVDYVSHSMKRHSSIFHNALRPNSALRQLFPTTVHSSIVPNTDEALKTLEETGTLSLNDAMLSDSDTETIKKTIERNVLRRSLIKYEPKKKAPTKEISSLEERIRQLTCDIDEPLNELENYDTNKGDFYSSKENISDLRGSPTGEETPNQNKSGDKNFSPSSSASSSLSGSVGSTYKKITDLFNRDKRQDRISENEETSAGIVPQDCRCPAGPDLGLGAQIQGGHTQIHQPPPPPPRHPDTRRQFLSTLVPLTACVAGQRDDFSYYTLAQPNNRNSISSSQCTDYSIGDIDKALTDEDSKKVAPDVIAGTPGQETDELAAFAQQEFNRTEKLKKRYSTENPHSNPGSDDDDEQNDYGFNKRPQVKGIKSRYTTNEMLQEMQNQLSQNSLQQPQKAQATLQTQTAQTQIVHSSTLPRPHTTMHIAAKQITSHHQHTASWSYYPEQQASNNNIQQDAHNNYYHLPANPRHSYHGHEAVGMQQTITHQPSGQYGKFARSPTRRPESPPPLRNYHQTMVLIPYNSNPYQQFTSTETESTFGRQHNVVEYQQVTQQTIRVPVGYTLPGMQLHVVGPSSHYTTLPRMNNGSKNLQFPQTEQSSINYKYNERGIARSEPEGAACVQSNDVALSPTNNQSQTSNINPQSSAGQPKSQPGAVYYAMNV